MKLRKSVYASSFIGISSVQVFGSWFLVWFPDSLNQKLETRNDKLFLFLHQTHFAPYALAFQLLKKHRMNIRRFFIEGNHLVQLRSIAVLAVFRAPTAHRKVAQRRVSRVEMAVIHEIAGRINGAGFDLESCSFFPFAPDHSEAFSLGHTNDRTGAVTMERAPAAGRKFLNVTAVSCSRQTETHDLHAFAFHRIIVESEFVDVRN